MTLVLSILALESEDSIRFLYRHFLSGITEKSLNAFYYEIMISAGLYEKNLVTGEKGYNLAAIMLFGKDEVIRSCVSGYVTDAIYRVENVNRYDDRLQVSTFTVHR